MSAAKSLDDLSLSEIEKLLTQQLEDLKVSLVFVEEFAKIYSKDYSKVEKSHEMD